MTEEELKKLNNALNERARDHGHRTLKDAIF